MTTSRSLLVTHHALITQGIAKSFSNAFHHVDLRKKLLRIVDAAMSWVHSRAPRVHNIVVYFVEPDPKGQAGHVLRKMVTADNNTGRIAWKGGRYPATSRSLRSQGCY